MSDIWYRFVDVRYAAYVNEFGEAEGVGRLEVRLDQYTVVKTTPKGVWLSLRFGDFTCGSNRFVLRDAHKRFACPTIEDAKVSFIARKTRQRKIHAAAVARAEEAMRIVEKKYPQKVLDHTGTTMA